MSDKVVGLEPVVATDHPDIVGGIVWSECELRWINSKLAALQAELAEANDSLTVAYMAGAASKLDEIRELQAELAECKRDARNSALDAAIADELESMAEWFEQRSYANPHLMLRNRANELRGGK